MPNNFQEKASFIWQVADDILRGAFKAHEYGDVILPSVVLRRLDLVHLTLGILRTSQAVLHALAFFWLDGFAIPALAREMHTVGRFLAKH